MVKSYLRYEPWKTFGVITSTTSNVIYSKDGTLAIAPALEEVTLWDLKKGILKRKWLDINNKAEVTAIAKNPKIKDINYYRIFSYADGSIRIWNIEQSTFSLIFNGHRGAVTALTFDKSGTRLASGSKDTDLIIWDVIGEVGLFRMRGHKDQITAIRFLCKPQLGGVISEETPHGYILSSSKDTLLKLWDLSTQHCMETVVAHRSEIWDFDISKDETLIVTGSDDSEMKLWTIDHDVLAQGLESESTLNDESTEIKKAIKFYGNIKRECKERVITLKFHPTANILGVQGPEKYVEIFRIYSYEEIKKKLIRRKKRQKEKKQKIENSNMDIDSDLVEINANDMITSYRMVRTSAKIRSFDFSTKDDIAKSGSIEILVSLTNNILELYTMGLPIKKKEKFLETADPSRLYSVDLSGHRNDIRTLALSSDDELLCSASKSTLKIWNMRTTSCLRTIDCGYALCSSFLPGDRNVIIGTKAGNLEIFDLASSSQTESIKAHDGPIWSLQVRPDKRELVTGSADSNVKFWEFDMSQDGDTTNEHRTGPRHLTLIHKRTLKMTDDILCVRYSPNQKLVAVALLDATVKVFYNDTLKFFLSLYGHKLPVLSMDISSDNKLLVTGSVDKNIKIWGLDFGDCHKSIFAHQDSITSIQFVQGTHYIFTAGKDKLVKYWDGDKFENITKLEGHHGEVWALAISKRGDLLVSGSHDRSIRIWEQTDEELFLEEEREKELEELYESTLTTSLEKTTLEDNVESTSAGKQTMETLKAGERIMEALDIADDNAAAWETYTQLKERGQDPGPPPKPNPILVALGNLTGDQYVLRTIEKIRSSELEEALLVLPFTKVISLFQYLDLWAKKEWNVALTCRITFHLLKVHHDQIVANRLIKPRLESLQTHIRAALKRQKDLLGYNSAALKYIKRDWENNNTAEFFDDIPKNEEMDSGSLTKRKFINLTV
ncbi:1195_t:CDS:10 [Dentiscutata erythropus]|uniref:1195_t:CDS:1 n=1 Tax=Dentiscutata erythropus TaxID=1348616 RepID=A0A9N9ALA0_9GLOM|nr:1195_t:CDS:10 [Dentiscutata erythropus]